MPNYTNEEYCDIHWVYAQANGNACEAARLYEQKFPTRTVPNRKTFSNVDILHYERYSTL